MSGQSLWITRMETFTLLAAFSWLVASPAAIPEPGAPGPDPVVYWDQVPAERPRGLVVVIDPGHDPEEPGALSYSGIWEVRINDRLAHRVAGALAGTPGIHPVVSRRSYERLPLAARVARIAALEPDLVVSLHHDSVKAQFITYRAADREGTHEGLESSKPLELPSCGRFSGYSLFAQAIGPHRQRSQLFARRVADGLRRLGIPRTTYHAMRIPGENRRWIDAPRGIHAGDYLYLLRKLDHPVVLVESGFLVNRADERRLRDPEHVEALAQTLATAIASIAHDNDASTGF